MLVKGEEGLCLQLQRVGSLLTQKKCYIDLVAKLAQSEGVKFRSDHSGIVFILKSGEDTDLKSSWSEGCVQPKTHNRRRNSR